MTATKQRRESPRSTADHEPITMTAVVYSEYGGPEVLRVDEVELPTPGDDEVLVRVMARSVNAGDWHLLRGTPFLVRLVYGGYRKPKFPILGVDIAGRVEPVGKNVVDFQSGDEVVANLSKSGFGGFAECVCVPAGAVVRKSATVSFEAAAAAPTAVHAHHCHSWLCHRRSDCRRYVGPERHQCVILYHHPRWIFPSRVRPPRSVTRAPGVDPSLVGYVRRNYFQTVRCSY
jgi:hypothetical protein